MKSKSMVVSFGGPAGTRTRNLLLRRQPLCPVELLVRPELSILFVGYAAPDSPAGRLKAAVQGEPFFFSEFAKEVVCHCKREDFDLTGHAYRDELIDLVGKVSPKTVILTHGSPDAKVWIQENIRRRYPDIQVLDPQPKEFITIEHTA